MATVRSRGDSRTKVKPAATDQPSEMYNRTMISANITVPHPRQASEMTLVIRHKRPELGWPDFCTNDQETKKKERNTPRPPANKARITRLAEPQSDRSAWLAAPEYNSPPAPLPRAILVPTRT